MNTLGKTTIRRFVDLAKAIDNNKVTYWDKKFKRVRLLFINPKKNKKIKLTGN